MPLEVSRHALGDAAGVGLVLDRQQVGGGERLSVATVSELDCGVPSDGGGDDYADPTAVPVVRGGDHNGGAVVDGGSVGLCHAHHDSHRGRGCPVPKGRGSAGGKGRAERGQRRRGQAVTKEEPRRSHGWPFG